MSPSWFWKFLFVVVCILVVISTFCYQVLKIPSCVKCHTRQPRTPLEPGLFYSPASPIQTLAPTTSQEVQPFSLSQVVQPLSPSQVRSPVTTMTAQPLSPEVVNGVNIFVMFIGYPRSGHSIIGSMMDAHPDMIVAHQFNIFGYMNNIQGDLNKATLFNLLYNDSYNDVVNGLRTISSDRKGYTLHMSNSWQGRYRKLKVIGDKCGGMTSDFYGNSPALATSLFSKLKRGLKIPIRVIHVVRNPFDMIATSALIRVSTVRNVKSDKYNTTHKLDDHKVLRLKTDAVFSRVKAVHTMKAHWNLNVLDVHSEMLVADSKAVIRQICDFVEVECPEDYVQQCYDKAYKEVSRTRDRVKWPADIVNWIHTESLQYPFLRGYSFNSSTWSYTAQV